MNNTTERESHYNHLEKMTVNELLMAINKEDQTVANAVHKEIPQISKLVDAIVERMRKGGRLFYIGAGTSGRLGVLDALTDILYVTYGYGAALGMDLDTSFKRVHESNMSKLDEDGKPIFREDGKVLKGPNYFKPNLTDLVT